MSQTLNANIAQCFKTQSNIGYDRIYDICHHTQAVVPWGTADWVGAVLLGGFVIVAVTLLLVLCAGVAKIVSDQ